MRKIKVYYKDKNPHVFEADKVIFIVDPIPYFKITKGEDLVAYINFEEVSSVVQEESK